MTGTSKAYKRLGVAGLGTVVAFAGLVPLTEVAAFAAVQPATSVSLSPDTDTAAVGTCNAFTATVAPADPANPAQITVNIQEAVPANTAAKAEAIGFCNPSASAEGNPTAATVGPGTPGSNTEAGVTAAPPATAANSCDNTTGGNPSAASNVSCNTTYTDTNGDGKIVFGVASTTPGTMTVNAFGETVNANGAQDAGEPGDTSTKTWVANSSANTNKISCTPATASNPAGTTHNFTCTVTDANGVALAGQKVGFTVASGPDAGAGYTPATTAAIAQSKNSTNSPLTASNAICDTATANGTAGSTEGTANCSYDNNGQPGTDNITVWVESNDTSGLQAGEPTTTITKTWVTAAAAGSQISVSCGQNTTSTTNGAGGATNTSSTCQDPTSDGSVTFTATVTNGVPAQPQSGVLVTWGITQNNGGNTTPANGTLEPAGETESLSDTSCLTNSSGQCSVTLTDATPTEGEAITVTGTVKTQTGQSQATGTKVWHDPSVGEARNIVVDPETQSGVSGGAATLNATVTDRFTNPVKGVQVDWTETGPGAFRSGTTCTTDATGKCSIEVTSLGTETGAETVTGTIHNSASTSECAAPADKSQYDATGFDASAANVTANANSTNGTTFANSAPGAPAGACSDSGTVNWAKQVTPPPAKTKITALINCFSPKKHVLKCKVKEGPAKAGLTVVFKRKTASGVHKIGVSVTNSNGVAKITKRHLKRHKIWRVFAHVRSTSTTTGATTGTDRTRIK